MGVTTMSGPTWSLEIDVQQIDVTSRYPTRDPSWRFTDANGHEHRGDPGYPSLRYIVDESHWCDGTEGFERHDPHEAEDAGHWECLACREVVEPGQLPAFYPQTIPGTETWTLKGTRQDGTEIEAVLFPAEIATIKADQHAVQRVLEAIPLDRATSYTVASR